MLSVEMVWLLVGGVAQFLFGLRMIVQWWVSEREGRSVVPAAFWYISFSAATMMLAYALYRRDAVFVAGQVLGLAVYVRNMALLRKTAAPAARPVEAEQPGAGTLSLDEARRAAARAPANGCTCVCTCGARAKAA